MAGSHIRFGISFSNNFFHFFIEFRQPRHFTAESHAIFIVFISFFHDFLSAAADYAFFTP